MLLTFTNRNGYELSASLELPVNQHPHTFAIFAHCFTCNKNHTAVQQISRALNVNGIAVLRFDFTGLGDSEGDFAETDFSSNVEDLRAAAHFLEENYRAPGLLIGHSLGGAAVLAAAAQLPSVKAVASIGAPAGPAQIEHLLQGKLEKMLAGESAEVRISGSKFKVKSRFLEDIRQNSQLDNLQELGRALLILHSPQDLTVPVDNARTLYDAARHPKSFISLDGADHLLSDKADSQYAGEMIAAWANRYLDLPAKAELDVERQVAVRLGSQGYTTEIMVRRHGLTADEPESVGGNDYGPSPYELVTAGLGACTAMTLHMYARRKNWDLREVTVQLDHEKNHASDSEHAEKPDSKIDHFNRILYLRGELDETQRLRLLEIANKCPVHRTLHNPVEIHTNLGEE